MKRRRLKFGLRWKLNLLMGAILLVTMSLFEGMGLYRERQMLINERAQHLEELAQHLAWVMQSAGDQNQQSLVANYERGINGDRDLGQRALILDAQSRIIAATNPQLVGAVMDESGALQSYQKMASETPARIFVQRTARMVVALSVIIRGNESRPEDQHLTVLISGPLDDIRESLRASLVTHLFHLLVTALALAVVTNLALSVFVLKPIRKLLAGMRRMERGEWTSDIPVRTNDEVGKLTRGYNALGRNLELKVRCCLVRAEKLASVALAAIHWNRELKKPIERIRGSADYLCRHNLFDGESAHAIGRIFDQTEMILALNEKFNRDFARQVDSEESHGEKNNGASQDSGVSPRQPQGKTPAVAHI